MTDKYYVFVNMENPIVINNFGLSGRITSAGYMHACSNEESLKKYLSGTAEYLPFVPNENRDNLGSSLFGLYITDLYLVEYNAEVCRQQFFKTLPSRMSCVYAFKKYEDCQKAIEKYRWNEGSIKEFYLEESPLNKVHRANMEIVSLMRGLGYKSCLDKEQEHKIWNHYWSGGGDITIKSPLLGTHQSGEIWEYLIEGSLVCASNA